MAKRKKDDTEQEKLPPCSWEDCGADASFKAPKSKGSIGSNRPDDYHYFCADHIGEYNKNWNFFSGMSEAEIDAFRHDALTGHLPTWDRETRKHSKRFGIDDINEALARFRGQTTKKTHHDPEPPKLTEQQRKALAVMDLPLDATAKQIKQRYKALVKQLHPDVNYGDRQSEERFKLVAESYRILQELK